MAMNTGLLSMSIRVWLLVALSLAVACGGDDGADSSAGGAGGTGSDDSGAGRGAAGTGGRGSTVSGTAGRSGAGGAEPGASGQSGAEDAGRDIGQGGQGGEDASGSDAGGSEAPPFDGAICTSDGVCEQEVELAPAQHVEGDIDYGDLPPAGGPHNPCWGDYGIHDDAFAPENWVHNLEHGAVVVLYDCPDGCSDELTQLEGFVDERSWGILAAYEDMDTRFALVAWGYRLMTDELDLEAFAAFYDAHANQAPESVSSGKPSGCP